jgi:multicomponent Na+:H+ antiporter subunit B
VSRKFLEEGILDTGALNAVASMLFEYRAFDTLAEAAVLITAICAVLILLRNDGPLNSFHAFAREATKIKQDIILKNMSFLLVGMILIFGVYIILNGHLTPSGGFSGGAIVGAALVLYASVFGTAHACRFLNYIVCCRILSISLLFYIVIKGFSFFTGANHIQFKLLPIGTPGNLFSGGLILPLNTAVGLIVACSMYMVFILFGREGVLK